MGRALLVMGLLALVSACEESPVAATPEPPPPAAAPAPAPPTVSPKVEPASAPLPSAPTAKAPSPPAAASNGSDPAQQLDASKKPAPVPAGEVCKGAAREGCVPKNDPFGFVARE